MKDERIRFILHPSSFILGFVRRAIYPGSFDPLHNGHLDVLRRAARLFDEVIVAVAFNEQKQTLLSAEERIELLDQSVQDLTNVRIARLEGLLVNFAREQKATVVIRGLRAISDFEFEFQMALMNRRLEPEIETVFLTPVEKFTYLSSRLVKEIAMLGGNVEPFVPTSVARALHTKFRG
jgi:pantetheine-phosphate adenylyltransferase